MLKILVVEDETVIRTALRRLLERNGYQVSEAGSVQEAESSHELEEFDLIISDLRLPGAAGTDLIRKAGDVPVLIFWNRHLAVGLREFGRSNEAVSN